MLLAVNNNDLSSTKILCVCCYVEDDERRSVKVKCIYPLKYSNLAPDKGLNWEKSQNGDGSDQTWIKTKLNEYIHWEKN